jgi:glycolate oxidase FAD binding subunit
VVTVQDLEIDGLRPGSVERPADESALTRALAEAAAAGKVVVPVGGGRLLGFGDRLQAFDLALDMTGMSEVLERSQADLTVSVQAGITLERLNEELERSGQYLPLDPPGGPGHTIGGLLATGLSGPLRLRYGSARDFLIGLRVALPEGTLATSGGRVVKNVSGYDLNKLHLGAMGSLGIVVAATFKVFPKPLHELTLAAEAGDPWAEADRALRSQMPPIALELSSAGQLLALVAGSETAARRAARELGWPAAEAAFWTEHEHRTGGTWARISAPPAALRAILETLPGEGHWWASPGVGTANWMGWSDPEAVLAARRAAEAVGGSVVLVNAPPAVKDAVGAWGTPPATLDRMRLLRDAFDPGRVISRGRYLV